MDNRIYLCIDLKSFYASVECMERGLNPLDANLVVADKGRTEKTICLAVSPSLKKYGISGRARLFEVVERVREINSARRKNTLLGQFSGESYLESELSRDPSLELSYIVAPPRMGHYMKYSTDIYKIYLKYISPEDIHVYSIDEVFMDITRYLQTYKISPRELAMTIIRDVLKATGITATAGLGTNMYLAKIAMDIVAKKVPADQDGVRIAELDEMSYRQKLWSHTPITDFWRVGHGYAKRLEKAGLYTMGDIAKCSVGKPTDYYNEELLYKLFGINAELLIDHAWGYEPCNIEEVKSYKPLTKSISSGQVLHLPYTFEKAKLILREMTELLVLDLVEKHLVTNQMCITIGYDIENILNPEIAKNYNGEITVDAYGRKLPKHAHGTANIKNPTSSTKEIMDAVMELYDRIVNPDLLVRRLNVVANNVVNEAYAEAQSPSVQLDFFTDTGKQIEAEENKRKERKIQEAVLKIKKKHGKNSILKGMNLKDGATTIDRNKQIGGHNA